MLYFTGEALENDEVSALGVLCRFVDVWGGWVLVFRLHLNITALLDITCAVDASEMCV